MAFAADRITLGTSYYPEHWPRQRWEKDVKLMAAAGIEVVRMAELAWATMQPAPNVFDFQWIDAAGHVGTIYQATNWCYKGLSQAQPALDPGDGVARHTRSVGSALGTYSIAYLQAQGINAHRVPGTGKHR